MALIGKLTKKLVENLSAGRHGDGGGLYLVVDPSGARRWIVRVVVKGQRNAKGAPLRTDFGLGGADVVTLNQARERALEYRRMAKAGLNPRFNAAREIPCFEEIARQVHIERLPTWKNTKHGEQWINTLRDYAFSKIGRMPVDSIGQPEVLMCLSPVWTDKHETARRLAQRIKIVLDVAKSKGFRSGENPVTAIQDAQVLPKVKSKPKHHSAMAWQDVPAFYADLKTRDAMAAKALMFTCLRGFEFNGAFRMLDAPADPCRAVRACQDKTVHRPAHPMTHLLPSHLGRRTVIRPLLVQKPKGSPPWPPNSQSRTALAG